MFCHFWTIVFNPLNRLLPRQVNARFVLRGGVPRAVFKDALDGTLLKALNAVDALAFLPELYQGDGSSLADQSHQLVLLDVPNWQQGR